MCIFLLKCKTKCLPDTCVCIYIYINIMFKIINHPMIEPKYFPISRKKYTVEHIPVSVI